MNLRQYYQADIANQRVILRADLDVNPDENSLRLERLVPTIKELLSFGAKQIIVVGHRGRPEGKFDEQFSLEPVRSRLSSLLGQEMTLVSSPDEAPDKYPVHKLLMLENLRFWPGEKSADNNFVQSLARWGEAYVNEAFAVCHRTDASMLALPQVMTKSFAGPGLAREIAELSAFTENPEHPYVVVLGGAKIETKLPLIRSLLTKADFILVGGGIANTLLKAKGYEIGSQSLVEESFMAEAKTLLNDKIVLPIDTVIADGAGAVKTVATDAVPADAFIGDIGQKTAALYKEKVGAAKMILWNGPMGKFEDAPYKKGTAAAVEAIVASSAKTLTGGGDTLDVLAELKVQDKFGFVSVGGGAMLTFLAGEKMPALEILYE